MSKKYWIDPVYIHEDASESKWALYEVEKDEDGFKVSEKVILWDFWANYEEDGDEDGLTDAKWERIDKRICDELGFVPDYDVG